MLLVGLLVLLLHAILIILSLLSVLSLSLVILFAVVVFGLVSGLVLSVVVTFLHWVVRGGVFKKGGAVIAKIGYINFVNL